MSDISNLLLDESVGATPEEHLQMLAAQRKDAERYRAIRALGVMACENPDEVEELIVKAQVPEEASTNEEFDAGADKLIEILAARNAKE